MEISSRKKTDFAPYTKATEIGRGTWFMNHLKSFNIIDAHDVESCLRDLALLKNKFPCHNCRKHFAEFHDAHPPRVAAEADLKALNRGERPEHLARWLVNAHNAANLHKFESYSQFHDTKFRPDDVKYEQVRDFFDSLGQEPCTGDCDKPDALRDGANSSTSSVKIVPGPTARVEAKVTEWKPKPTPKETKPASKAGLRIRIVSSQNN